MTDRPPSILGAAAVAGPLRSAPSPRIIPPVAPRSSIFDRVQLRPAQLRTVADRRFDDALALVHTGHNARANGAMYLGGFVVECLLKAALLDEHPWLQSAGSPHGRPAPHAHLWSLCYRSHDLEEILAHLPDLRERIAALGTGGPSQLLRRLHDICKNWTIFARYSPHSAIIREAEDFLAVIRELKPWLK